MSRRMTWTVVAVLLVAAAALGGWAWRRSVTRSPAALQISEVPIDTTGLVPLDRPVPVENAAAVELGRLLFFDPRLSGDDDMSCATCHDPARGFCDERVTGVG